MFFCDLLHVRSEFSLDSCQSWKYMKDSFFSQESCRSSADVKGAMPGLQSHTHYRFYFEYSWYQKTDPLSWTCLRYLQQHAIFYYNIVHYTIHIFVKAFTFITILVSNEYGHMISLELTVNLILDLHKICYLYKSILEKNHHSTKILNPSQHQNYIRHCKKHYTNE